MLLHVCHPQLDELFNLFKRAKTDEANKETKDLLREITKACQTCLRLAPKPQIFRVYFQQGVVFIQNLCIDPIFIKKNRVLHIFDLQTHFSAVSYLKGQSLDVVW